MITTVNPTPNIIREHQVPVVFRAPFTQLTMRWLFKSWTKQGS